MDQPGQNSLHREVRSAKTGVDGTAIEAAIDISKCDTLLSTMSRGTGAATAGRQMGDRHCGTYPYCQCM